MVNNVWCKALILQRVIGTVSIIPTVIGFWCIKNRAVMCRYNGVHITHATIAYLSRVLIKNFVEKVRRGECLSKRLKKTSPILVLTFNEYDALDQIILLLHLYLSFACGLDRVSGIKMGFF